MELFKLFGTIALNGAKEFNSSVDGAVGKASSASVELGKAVAAIDTAITSVGKAALSVMGTLASASASAVDIVAELGISFNAQMEGYRTALTTLTGSAEEANQILDTIKEDAALTPFNISNLTQGTRLLLAAGVEANETREIILSLGDAVAASGGNDEVFYRMSYNLQQVANAGKATAVDIRQFATAGIDIYGLLADYTGKTKEEMQDTEISWDLLSKALVAGASKGGKYFGAMAAQSKTFNGQISNLKDNWSIFIGSVTSGLFDIAKNDALPQIIEWVEELQLAYDNLGLDGVVETVGEILGDIVNIIAEYSPQIIELATDIVVSFIATIGENTGKLKETGRQLIEALFGAFNDCMGVLLPIVKDLVPVVAEAFLRYQKQLREIGIEVLTAIITGIAEEAENLAAVAVDLITQLSDCIIENLDELTIAATEIVGKIVATLTDPKTLSRLLDAAVEILFAIANFIIDNLDDLVGAAVSVVTQIVDTISNEETLGKLLDAALKILTALGTSIVDNLSTLTTAAIELVSGLVSYILEGDNLAKMIEAAVDLIVALGEGLLENAYLLEEKAEGLAGKLAAALLKVDWAAVGSEIFDMIFDFGKFTLKHSIFANTDVFGMTAEESEEYYDNLAAENYENGKWLRDLLGIETNNEPAETNGTDAAREAADRIQQRRQQEDLQYKKLTFKEAQLDGSHADGLDYVPYDGYMAELHKGEMVVPAKDSNFLRSNGINADNAEILQVLQQILEVLQSGGFSLNINNREFARMVKAVG